MKGMCKDCRWWKRRWLCSNSKSEFFMFECSAFYKCKAFEPKEANEDD